MRIALYVSDHGYGHATRSIALTRALVEEGDGAVMLEILNHHAHGLLKHALRDLPAARVLDRPTDVGFVCREDRLAFDMGPTALAVSSWLWRWKRFVAEEVERLRSRTPDLIISDVAPEPLLVAEKLGVPSLVASNFTWVDQYEPHLRADLVAPIRGSYALASRGHAYAMRTALAGIRNIVPAGLVTREARWDREVVRRRLGVGDGEPLVHLGFGWSADAGGLGADLDGSDLPRGVRLLVSSNLARVASLARLPGQLLVIPDEETEAHEYIAACDLVIAKAGYGTISEAIAARVPILAVPVQGSVESEVIARTIELLDVGVAYPAGEPLGARLLGEGGKMLENLDPFREAYRRMPSEFARGAATRLARTILEGL